MTMFRNKEKIDAREQSYLNDHKGSTRGEQITAFCHPMAFRMDCFFTAHMAFLSPSNCADYGHFLLNSQFYSKEPLYIRTQMGCYLPENLLPGSLDNKLNINQTIPLYHLAPSPHTYL